MKFYTYLALLGITHAVEEEVWKECTNTAVETEKSAIAAMKNHLKSKEALIDATVEAYQVKLEVLK